MKYPFALAVILGLLILNPTSTFAEKPLHFSSGAGAMSGMIDIAVAKGFIEGKSAQMHVFKDGSDALNAFLKGQVDIGTTSPNSIVISNEFDPNKHAIVAILSHTDNQLKLLTRNASGIRQIPDLKGKKIATAGFFNQFVLCKLLDHNGITSSDVTITTLQKNQMPPAIASGQVDAIFQHGKPIENSKKLLGDNGWMIFQNSNIERKLLVMLMNREMLADNPELVEQVLQAALKAQDYYRDNPDECIEILAKSKKYSFPQMKEAMDEINYNLTLRQSLLLTMETMDKWGIDNDFIQKRTPRNYFDYIDPKPLLKVAPTAVTLIY